MMAGEQSVELSIADSNGQRETLAPVVYMVGGTPVYLLQTGATTHT